MKPSIGIGIRVGSSLNAGAPAKTLSEIFTEYNFLNMWTSENIDVSGTVTTLFDYAGEHDLVNPAAINQPTLNISDANFGGKPSLSFDGVSQYISKNTPNWRGTDTSGVFVVVYKAPETLTYGLISLADNANNGRFFTMGDSGTGIPEFRKGGLVLCDGATASFDAKVVATAGTGTVLKNFLNGSEDTGTPAAYSWINSYSPFIDNISIGAVLRPSVIYRAFDIAMVGYLQYTNEADIINVQNDLTNYY